MGVPVLRDQRDFDLTGADGEAEFFQLRNEREGGRAAEAFHVFEAHFGQGFEGLSGLAAEQGSDGFQLHASGGARRGFRCLKRGGGEGGAERAPG